MLWCAVCCLACCGLCWNDRWSAAEVPKHSPAAHAQEGGEHTHAPRGQSCGCALSLLRTLSTPRGTPHPQHTYTQHPTHSAHHIVRSTASSTQYTVQITAQNTAHSAQLAAPQAVRSTQYTGHRTAHSASTAWCHTGRALRLTPAPRLLVSAHALHAPAPRTLHTRSPHCAHSLPV